jgi:hypothetical protein
VLKCDDDSEASELAKLVAGYGVGADDGFVYGFVDDLIDEDKPSYIQE